MEHWIADIVNSVRLLTYSNHNLDFGFTVFASPDNRTNIIETLAKPGRVNVLVAHTAAIRGQRGRCPSHAGGFASTSIIFVLDSLSRTRFWMGRGFVCITAIVGGWRLVLILAIAYLFHRKE